MTKTVLWDIRLERIQSLLEKQKIILKKFSLGNVTVEGKRNRCNPCENWIMRLFVVAGVDEISNFELLRNLKKIVDFITML
jgi:hypothetical protein